jgi:hypothetical protein
MMYMIQNVKIAYNSQCVEGDAHHGIWVAYIKKVIKNGIKIEFNNNI